MSHDVGTQVSLTHMTDYTFWHIPVEYRYALHVPRGKYYPFVNEKRQTRYSVTYLCDTSMYSMSHEVRVTHVWLPEYAVCQMSADPVTHLYNIDMYYMSHQVHIAHLSMIPDRIHILSRICVVQIYITRHTRYLQPVAWKNETRSGHQNTNQNRGCPTYMFLFKRAVWKETCVMSIQNSELFSNDHFGSHLFGNEVYHSFVDDTW